MFVDVRFNTGMKGTTTAASTTTTVMLMLLCWFTTTIRICSGHGYTTLSRNFLCQQGKNTACGNIVYEPQSLEAPKGFPAATASPPDGKLASAGIDRFATLDEQSAERWTQTHVQAGPWTVTWLFTANHRTTGYEYYLTRQGNDEEGWNPNAPLTRAQFDLTPFCTVPRGGVQPPASGDTQTCHLPPRTGYQVLLGEWRIDDTEAAFYNVK